VADWADRDNPVPADKAAVAVVVAPQVAAVVLEWLSLTCLKLNGLEYIAQHRQLVYQ
jgi:hypothetical protein